MTSNNVPQRINTFQGARFIFVLFIFLSHCVMANLNTFEFGGECGVAFFFTLSGFVLSWGHGRNVQERTFHHRRFLWRHLSGLYPLHLLLFIIVLAFDLKADYHYDAVQLLTNLLLLQSWVPSDHTLFTINGVSWFLCNTIFYYLVFPYLYRLVAVLISKRRFFVFSLFFALLYLVLALYIPNSYVNCTLYVNPLLRIPDFALGIAACLFYKNINTSTNNFALKWLRLPLLIDVITLLLTYFIYQHLLPNLRCAALFWIVMPPLIMKLAYHNRSNDMTARLLSSKPLSWLGGISFEFFITHTLILRIVRHFIPNNGSLESDGIFILLSLLITITTATLLHKYFVRPIAQALCQR